MTKDEAEAAATKRNAHKGRSMAHMTWRAKDDSDKGWQLALEPTHPPKPKTEKKSAEPEISGHDLLRIYAALGAIVCGPKK